ncbi:hypothetical protein B5X24_HaOG214297 [Helicoverpa armigera]|nr:hypothetical protein B5X24_HaOG214297 [Helicoverpa armigera]
MCLCFSAVFQLAVTCSHLKGVISVFETQNISQYAIKQSNCSSSIYHRKVVLMLAQQFYEIIPWRKKIMEIP